MSSPRRRGRVQVLEPSNVLAPVWLRYLTVKLRAL